MACAVIYSQQITTDNTLSIDELILNNLDADCVDISNINSSVNGSNFGVGNFGSFQRGNSSFPFESGIILSTGNVNSAGNAVNNQFLNDGDADWGTDPDLENTLGIDETINATSVEFDFVSISNTLVFNYILASEEYFANFPCQYSDGFAL